MPANVPSIHGPKSDLVDDVAAAEYIGAKPGTLAVWRCTKRYQLPYIKIGRLVRYRKSDLDAFIVARTVSQ